MDRAIHAVALPGLRPTPIAGYLGALGILRLVSEQADAQSAGHWDGDQDCFFLTSSLDRGGLEEFLLDHYRPTPLLAPWNGGSGFYPKDKGAFKHGLSPIESGSSSRFSEYRSAIEACRRGIDARGLRAKPSTDKTKQTLLRWLRGNLADSQLHWLEASILLGNEGAKYPPLLGSGGNDGRLEFSANFMQCVVSLIDPDSGECTPSAGTLVRQTVFGELASKLGNGAIGQFAPGSAGGVNATTGYGDDSLTNPWDLILALEGSVALSSVAVRRFASDTGGALSFPFSVRPAAVAYGSAATTDRTTARSEIWLPVWSRPTSYSEVHALFAEGRVTVAGRRARNGIDFYRAVASLGVDRGIEGFERYGLLRRNGLSYFAVPIERVSVEPRRAARVLEDIDTWLDVFRRRTSTDPPPNLARVRQRLETAVVEVCRRDDATAPRAVNDLLIVLGEVETELARRPKFVEGDRYHLPPIPRLSRRLWLSEAEGSSKEFVIAQALASIGGLVESRSASHDPSEGETGRQPRAGVRVLREYLAPIECSLRRARWNFDSRRSAAAGMAAVEATLAAVLRRVLLDVESKSDGLPLAATHCAPLSAVRNFLAGQTDDRYLLGLLRGLSLLNWYSTSPRVQRGGRSDVLIHPLYSLLALCHVSASPDRQDLVPGEGSGVTDSVRAVILATQAQKPIPLDHRIFKRARAGDAQRASRLAARRLRASGLEPAIDVVHADSKTTKRVAAALLIPISFADRHRLERQILRPDPDAPTSNGEPDELPTP